MLKVKINKWVRKKENEYKRGRTFRQKMDRMEEIKRKTRQRNIIENLRQNLSLSMKEKHKENNAKLNKY